MEITPLPARRSFNCYSGCLTALLERKGWIYSEPVAVGLCGGLNLEFTALGQMHYRGVRELHCVTEFLEGRGLRAFRHVEPDKVLFESIFLRNIRADLPTIVEYDGYFFPYTQIYGERHERRIGLLVGCDEQAYFMTDPIYGVEQVRIPRSLFFGSRSLTHGAAVEAAWYEVEMSGPARDEGPRAAASIAETAEYMLQAESEFTLRGIQGARRFAAQAARRLQEFRDIRGLQEFSEELRQGAILFDHYSEFLERASRLWGTPSSDVSCDAAQRAQVVASHMRLASALVWKSTMSDPARCGERLSQAIRSVGEEAAEMFTALKAVQDGCPV